MQLYVSSAYSSYSAFCGDENNITFTADRCFNTARKHVHRLRCVQPIIHRAFSHNPLDTELYVYGAGPMLQYCEKACTQAAMCPSNNSQSIQPQPT
ncbi:hypothetical protein J6590_059379 [Homalodisca vitripennis]|nr:hypothetical protein J6590_059379 [Homalodisca vitripennis]